MINIDKINLLTPKNPIKKRRIMTTVQCIPAADGINKLRRAGINVAYLLINDNVISKLIINFT